MVTKPSNLMTAEELARIPDDGYQYELVRGELRRIAPTSFRPSNIAARTIARLVAFADAHGLGEVTAPDGGYELEQDPDTVLAPDVAFVRADRVPRPEEHARFLRLAPDLAVEVVSPHDATREVAAKAAMWLDAGVRLVWVVDPSARTVAVHAPGRPVRILAPEDELDGGEVLPSFRVPVAELFR